MTAENHAKRVADLCEAIAKKLDLSQMSIDQIRLAGQMHDIGKIGIDGKLLKKGGVLSKKEQEQFMKYPLIGYRILSSAHEFSEIAVFVLEHQEKWDGTGYPKGLKGEEIALPARIVAVADAYDGMVNDPRPSRAMTKAEAAVEIRRLSARHFDPAIVKNIHR